ncbi:MAG: maleylpyruvate isomerase family mycothiol-dependent enzyme, partial [Acidimicrobiales bacterium]
MTDRSFVDQLADTWAALASLGRELGPGEWSRPTECPGWEVRDHYAHVVGTESSLLGRPPPPSAPAAPHVRNPLGEMNEAWVAHWRPLPVGELLAQLEAVTSARLGALRAMTDEELDKPGWSPVGEVPYATFMGIRVLDCWVHEQDARQATGRPWRFEGPGAPASLDRLLSSLGYVVGKKVGPPEGTVVRLRIPGPL